MAELATLARPYAAAVYELAREVDQVDAWRQAVELLGQAASESTVRELIAEPMRTATQKAESLYGLFRDRSPLETRNFLSVLAASGRLELLPEIRQQFAALQAADALATDIEITTAAALEPGQLEAFRRALETRFQSPIDLAARVDPAILGGAVIRMGDTVLDASMRGKLEKMREALSHS